MKNLMFLLFALLCTATINAQMTPTGEGGYVLPPTVARRGVAPDIGVQYINISKTETGRLSFSFPGDAVDEIVGSFYLEPRLSGEKNSRSVPIFLRKVSGGYEFATVAMFSVDDDGRLLFAGEKVDAFEVFRLPSSSPD